MRRALGRAAAWSLLFFIGSFFAAPAAEQPLDKEYTAKILEYTTEKFFLTELVDHLPASATVLSPLRVLGHIAGAPDILDYSKDIYRYLQALAKASPRARLFTLGSTDQGKEMIALAVSSEDNISRLERIRAIMAKLADPRQLKDEEAATLLAEAVPVYWITGGLHSLETGAPEMMMELAYRLAVEDSAVLNAIRRDVIVLLTPILEVDGWDRMVDVYRYKKVNKGKSMHLPYWGDYVFHDNNRDAIGLGLKLTENCLRTIFEWHPIVHHDLHESIAYLYVSSGTGPYNAWLDPITIDEWEEMAMVEVGGLTQRGVPGVWTHGFFDGWAPSYVEFLAMTHNALGRFYETFGGIGADTQVLTTGRWAQRAWFRPNPPLEAIRWSFRNNINLQQSGLLLALQHMATNRVRFMQQFYLKSKRAVAKATSEGPAAYIIPGNVPRPLSAASLVNLLRRQGIEVQRAETEIVLGKDKYPAGSYVVRMDQPYSRCADMLLDTQYYNPKDPRPYDDTGWTLGPLFNVRTVRVTDTAVLQSPMKMIAQDVRPEGKVIDHKTAVAYLIANRAECELATLRYRLPDMVMQAAEVGFMEGERKFAAGSFIIPLKSVTAQARQQLEKEALDLGLELYGVAKLPEVKSHATQAARLALLHSWINTQDEGWFRIALEKLHIPFAYLALQEVRSLSNLRSKYDVIMFPPTGEYGKIQRIVNGLSGNEPMPYLKSAQTPNLGIPDSRADIRGGLDLEGIANLQRFVKEGGLFIAVGNVVSLPIDYGMVESVAVRKPKKLNVVGSVLNASISDSLSPLVYGYEREKDLPVYFSQGPVLEAGQGAVFGDDGSDILFGADQGRPSGRGGLKDPDVPQGRPSKKEPIKDAGTGFPPETKELIELYLPPDIKDLRVVLRFEAADKLLISGLLDGGEELANRPALIDVKSGQGHVVLFALNPMWRQQTRGTVPLVLNALLHCKSLDAGKKPTTEKK